MRRFAAAPAVVPEDLASVALLAGLDPDQLERLSADAVVTAYAPGDVIFRTGDLSNALQVLRKGRVKTLNQRDGRADLVLSTVSPGASIDELEILAGAPHSTTAIALEPAEVIAVGKEEIDSILDSDPKAMRSMLAALSNALTSSKEELATRESMMDLKVEMRSRELRETRLEVIRRLSRAAEFRDDDTGMHISRMSRYSVLIAKSAGFSESECDLLLNAAPMHDIGKIGIPDGVLLKPGKLDGDEWEIMQSHTILGARILEGSNTPIMKMACAIALSHHEKWNGAGYPEGRSGEDIPIMARVCAIADVFDALTSERPYKKAWTIEDAIGLITEEAGKHFDPNLVPAFLAIEEEIRHVISHQTELAIETGAL
jgi:response regulator RpfG family c-di-GMP phosphodiesterase